LPSEREHNASKNGISLQHSPEQNHEEQPKIRSIDEASASRLKAEVSKNKAKFKYDPEEDKIIRIKRDL
jgi:hypothetical protein